ncbi:MAG: 30S ribosomal protein S9 [Bacteroidetes bacterium]|nr:30S ribosomal protein S9 [Bacteroidota bacterium]MBU2584948.1 30S ribosomal protein S9 [Bacteroidota bacterium]
MADKIAVGRRKTSVARVTIRPGSGNVNINNKSIDDYLPTEHDRKLALAPVEAVEVQGNYDFIISAHGGGISGQVGAIKLGIARALLLVDEEFRPILRKGGFLTRDSRMVERKKYGRPKARKRFQFSKR